MVQYDKSTAHEVRRRVADHLQSNGIFADLKRIVADVVGGVEGDATLSAISQKDLITQIVREQGGPSPALPPAASDDCLLHITMLGGRAFVDSVVRGQSDKGSLRLCLQFGEQRFASRSVPSCAEPAFADTFLLRLPLPADLASYAGKGASRGEQRAQALLRLKQPVHLVVLQRRGQQEVLLSSLLLEWRKVLQAGRCVLSAELPGVGPQARMPVGSLELRLELLPSLDAEERVGGDELLAQLQREREAEVSAERRFFDYAKQWWAGCVRGTRRPASPATPPQQPAWWLQGAGRSCAPQSAATSAT
jgi:hypothetical protein